MLKSRFEHDRKGVAGESHLEDSKVWEDMENPKEMKDFMTKNQSSDGIQYELTDKTYVGVDKFITGLKRVSGKTKFNRGRYGVSNTMSGIMHDIYSQEGNLPQRQALWRLIQAHFKYAESWKQLILGKKG